VRVIVQTDSGGWVVDPLTLVVLHPEADPDVRAASTTSLLSGPKDDPIFDLNDAQRRGLVRAAKHRRAAWWTELETELDEMSLPLRNAGWRRSIRDREESGRYGDSVIDDYKLNTWSVDLELYEDGAVCIFEPYRAEGRTEDDALDQETAWVAPGDRAALAVEYQRLRLLDTDRWR
jgi:hypothetical protein